MTDKEMMDLIARFRDAFKSADPEKLSQVLTDDFVWHQHFADGAKDRPTGRIVHGVEGMIRILEWRKKNWKKQRIADLVERPAGDVILQMFTTQGINEDDEPFHWNVVDVYPVRDGKIAKKDTYWKQAK